MLTPAILISLLLLTAPAVAGRPVGDPVLQDLLLRLDARLDEPAPLHAAQLLAATGQATGQSATEIRAHLRGRLAALAALRADAPEAWSALLDLDAENVSRRQADRLLTEVLAATDDILASDDDYLLRVSIRHVARRARMPGPQAYGFVRCLIVHGITDTTQDWAPEPVGFVISGWTEAYEYSLDPLFLFFATEDEAFVLEAVRDVQRFVVPRLASLLPRSRGASFALRDRELTALVDPEYRAHVVVQSLRFGGTGTDLRPCADLRLEVTAAATAAAVWSTTLSHCTQTHGSARTRELGPFFDEIAELLAARLDAWLETPR